MCPLQLIYNLSVWIESCRKAWWFVRVSLQTAEWLTVSHHSLSPSFLLHTCTFFHRIDVAEEDNCSGRKEKLFYRLHPVNQCLLWFHSNLLKRKRQPLFDADKPFFSFVLLQVLREKSFCTRTKVMQDINNTIFPVLLLHVIEFTSKCNS